MLPGQPAGRRNHLTPGSRYAILGGGSLGGFYGSLDVGNENPAVGTAALNLGQRNVVLSRHPASRGHHLARVRGVGD